MRRLWLTAALLLMASVVAGAPAQKWPEETMGKPPTPEQLKAMGTKTSGAQQAAEHLRQFRQYASQHKNAIRLARTVAAIGDMEKTGKQPLTRQQAQKILALILPLTKGSDLTESDAQMALQRLRSPLTRAQLLELGLQYAKKQRIHKYQQKLDPKSWKTFNPFDPKSANPLAQRYYKSVKLAIDILEKKTGGKM